MRRLEKDEIILPVQRMFPNCRKYTRCCKDDPVLVPRGPQPKPRRIADYIVPPNMNKTPKDFKENVKSIDEYKL